MEITKDIKKPFEMACQSLSHVLITGPTGSGKSSLARKIHQEGVRDKGPFVEVNLASLYEGTLESELFGHEKGAFTGADRKRVGKFELARGGTLFLDEIGELSPKLQARLLEFLQSYTLCPVGGNYSIHIDVRVIAATHRYLDQSVAKGEFRADLFHRLRAIPISLKPLVERPLELDPLVHRFIEEYSKKYKKPVSRLYPGVAEKLETYSWPGNIRELKNTLDYAVLASEGAEIRLEHLPPWLFHAPEGYLLGALGEQNQTSTAHSAVHMAQAPLGIAEVPLTLDYQDTLVRFEKEYIRRALSRNGGRISRTARQIGLNKTTLLRRVRAYGLQSFGL